MNKHFLLLISFGFSVLGMQNRIEAATKESTNEPFEYTEPATSQLDQMFNRMLLEIKNLRKEMGVQRRHGKKTVEENVNSWSFPGNQTPLMIACEAGDKDKVRSLLANGATINISYNGRPTALMLACQHGNPEIVELLLDNDADVDGLDSFGRTAFEFAQTPKIIEILLNHKQKTDTNASHTGKSHS